MTPNPQEPQGGETVTALCGAMAAAHLAVGLPIVTDGRVSLFVSLLVGLFALAPQAMIAARDARMGCQVLAYPALIGSCCCVRLYLTDPTDWGQVADTTLRMVRDIWAGTPTGMYLMAAAWALLVPCIPWEELVPPPPPPPHNPLAHPLKKGP